MIELPTLYAKTAKGGIDQWTVSSDGPFVIMTHGALGGKQVVHKTPAEPTNVGRANQRNAEEQARFEAQSAWNKKRDQGYFCSVDEAKTAEVLLPMLAQKFKPKNLRFPVSCQPKYDGLRCMAIIGNDGEVSLMSRGGKEWTVPHIEAELKLLGQPGDIFDGELYIHGVPLQTLNSLVKNEAKDARLALQYFMYDMPKTRGCGTHPWEIRWAALCGRYLDFRNVAIASGATTFDLSNPLRLAETRVLNREDEIKAFEREAILGGYEGLILRLHGDEYAFGLARPKSLMKWKTFQDAEFEVVDMRSMEYNVNGRQATICDVCFCRNDLTDATFKVKPRGSVDQLAEYWKKKDHYIGRRLIVRFLTRSIDKIPQGNPIGLAFRLDDDSVGDLDDNPWS